ncbi:MAG: hypothetical protein LKJ13_01375 [Clostridia bacterium]|jgi:hypothetical protein|nr:hypothetical protein [Clostridia bacterium]MCI2000499.1 hypothetical protein [Clostridia bacterium]MCI2014954.1 hypothetical protein [Clostridia bacterium]
MKLMHTKLPDFCKKVAAAGKKLRPETEVVLRGLESMKSAKLASLRVGRIEEEIIEITQDPNVAKVEVTVLPQIPETIHTVVIKGVQKDGKSKKTILESMFITTPAPECYYHDSEEVDDRRVSYD